jgi:hypothetical protein
VFNEYALWGDEPKVADRLGFMGAQVIADDMDGLALGLPGEFWFWQNRGIAEKAYFRIKLSLLPRLPAD